MSRDLITFLCVCISVKLDGSQFVGKTLDKFLIISIQCELLKAVLILCVIALGTCLLDIFDSGLILVISIESLNKVNLV